jgi:beta-lactamase superfamily II metal-dependent hydrolase
LEIHFLDVGCGNATIIYAMSETYLIDCNGIENHKHLLPESKVIKALFITHQHKDHHSGMQYLRDEGFSIEYLIYSPYERRYGDNSVTKEEWDDFESYKKFFANKGTKLYNPYRQETFKEAWWTPGGLSIWLLGPANHIATSDTRQIHDASLVMRINNSRTILFPGDASETSLQYVAENTTNTCDDILLAAHHGSLEGANLDFIKVSNPKYTVISTESGIYENIPHPTAIERYEDHTTGKVYRTDVDGSIKFT